MILQCPACNARYAVPDHAIGASGRTVRCTKCANEWFVSGVQATDIETLNALLSEPEKPVLRAVPTGSSVPAHLKTSTSGLKMALAACAVLAAGTTLFSLFPAMFGFNKNTAVVLTDLSLEKQEVEKGMEYAISGKMVNTSDQPVKPPKVRITLVDPDGAPMQYWEPLLPDVLEKQEPVPFTFGPLKTKFTRGDRLVIELGNTLELALRKKP